MPVESERQRVAAAMKPARRKPSPVEPPEDDDPLLTLGTADPADVADDVAVWKMDAGTRAKVKEFQTLRMARIKQLCAAALQSTDPKVAAIAGQINGVSAVIVSMGGKA